MNGGLVMTVDGPIESDDLGITLTHEHLLLDLRSWRLPPRTARQTELASRELSLEMLGEVRRDALVFEDNLLLDDAALALTEVREFAAHGGRTIVDLSSVGLRLDVPLVRDVCRQAELQLIVGCGYYVRQAVEDSLAEQSVGALTDQLLKEIHDGVDGSSIRPGIIGEIGTSQPIDDAEWKFLEASCNAQKETGLPLTIHVFPTPQSRTAPTVARYVMRQGVDPEKVNIAHMDGHMNVDYQARVAEFGCFISFDGFGLEVYYDSMDAYRPHDSERERCIIELLNRGYGDQILISQDICMKVQLQKYGGFGYGHILRSIVPSLQRRGLAESEIDQILLQNPRRFLAVGGTKSSS